MHSCTEVSEDTKPKDARFVFSMLQVNHKMVQKEPEMILDSGSTISLFKNGEVLKDIKICNNKLVMETNAGTKTLDKKAHIPGYGEVYFDKDAVSNLLSLSELVRRGNRVFYDSSIEDCFVVTCENSGKVLRFPVDHRGLYVKEATPIDCCVMNQVEGFTDRQVECARRARKLYHDLSAPSLSDLKQFIRQNIAKNNPVTVEDIQLAEDIFGKDVATLKGKSTRPHLPVVTRKDVVDLPPELQISEVELAMDVLFINDQAFFHAKDRTIKFKGLVPLGTVGKKKSYSVKDLFEGLDKILRHYNKAAIRIAMIHADKEFKPRFEEVEDRWDIALNFSAPDEHVPDIERENRTLQDRFRVALYRLPFKIIPRLMIRELAMRVTWNGTCFPAKGGISKHYSPRMTVSNRAVDCENISCIPLVIMCRQQMLTSQVTITCHEHLIASTCRLVMPCRVGMY